MNEAHWNRPNGPVFLYIGGEGLLSKFSVLAGIHSLSTQCKDQSCVTVWDYLVKLGLGVFYCLTPLQPALNLGGVCALMQVSVCYKCTPCCMWPVVSVLGHKNKDSSEY